MEEYILNKINSIIERFNLLDNKLSELNEFKDDLSLIELQKEHSSLKVIVNVYFKYNKVISDMSSLVELINDGDIDIKELANEEYNLLINEKTLLESKLNELLFPKEKEDDCNIYLEIRAATGGDEAAIFSEDLFKMYSSYFSYMNWNFEVMSFNIGNSGGYKEIIFRVIGSGVFIKMKYESGIHRVQRIPKTETRGRIHTSTCSVAILPEIKIVDSINLDFSDLRIDTYRAGGAGGQHVNVTDSAVRIIHKPTGIIAECQDERSQHKNKQKALILLKSRILSYEKSKQKGEIDDYRRKLIGTGLRSEKIRTYNYPCNRITDHRFNLTLYKLEDVMSGKLWILLDLISK